MRKVCHRRRVSSLHRAVMRPNLAMDAPPEALCIAGEKVPVATDYRVWLMALPLLWKFPDDGAYAELVELLFGGDTGHRREDVLWAVAGFLRGYPSEDEGAYEEENSAPSLEWDINEIVLDIRDRTGLDLSYRRTEPFHWWLFLLEAGRG